MATEHGHQEFDLDRTDRLPILSGPFLEAESPADSDATQNSPRITQRAAEEFDTGISVLPALTNEAPMTLAGNSTDFLRPSSIDLPSLAESLRSVEERIARQSAEYETLNRSYERNRESEAAAVARASVLESNLAAMRTSLEVEQTRVREHEKTVQERNATAESARARAEDALRESERFQSEARTLRESLATRDATIMEVLHSLGERDTQLATLQQEHVKLHQSLETRGKSNKQMESELGSAAAKNQQLSAAVQSLEENGSLLGKKLRRTENEVNTLRAELGTTRAASSSYLELLRSREWRRGFDENLYMELDAKVGAVDATRASLTQERDRFQSEAANFELKLASQTTALEKLQANWTAQNATVAKQSHDLKEFERTRTETGQRLAALESECERLSADLAQREAALAAARSAADDNGLKLSTLQTEHAARLMKLQTEHGNALAEVQEGQLSKVARLQSDHTATSSRLQEEHAAQVAKLQGQHSATVADLMRRAEQRDQEITVLMVHLQEARRPIEPIEAEVKRLTEELGAKTKAHDQLNVEAQELRTSLERTRGALEEREFLIRRLERSESNNANVLGRIQTSMERLGSAAASTAQTAAAEWSAELIRVDGERNLSHSLGRRTRIGRSTNCELQVDSSSVSRHHAVVVAGPRESIIEDLNSTNGVIVNGRKITRAYLHDGDTVIVGEVQFRFRTKTAQRAAEQPPLESGPVE